MGLDGEIDSLQLGWHLEPKFYKVVAQVSMKYIVTFVQQVSPEHKML